MRYNFDNIINRRGTDSYKYDNAKARGKPESAIPLWVAEMDFQIPQEATEAILKCANHGIYGYTLTMEDYDRAVQYWFARYFGFESKSEWIVKTPGVVFALAMAVRAFTNKNDSVMIQMPVYNPFAHVIKANDRKVINNALVYKEQGVYQIDFDDFQKKIVENNVKMFILCSPHNPVGRVWTIEELQMIGKICKQYDCLVISDEIHCDLTYEGHVHRVFSTVCDNNSVICTAPSKTFNLAGLQVSNIFISDEELRRKFVAEVAKSGYSQLNTMGVAACKAVYQHGHDWLAELHQYLQGNLQVVRDAVKTMGVNTKKVKMVEPEGTYLVWLDFSAFGLPHVEVENRLLNDAGVWLGSGMDFGLGGEGFWRMNIACPRQVLKTALDHMGRVFGK